MIRAPIHGSTFSKNNLAMAAGIATLRVLKEENLVEHAAARRGPDRRPPADRAPRVPERGARQGPDVGDRVQRAAQRGRRLAAARGRAAGPVQPARHVPLFRDHRILRQVAGHNSNVVKFLPPLVVDEADVDWFVEALESVLERTRGIPREMVGFALRAARAR